ncbi:MAG: NAD-dependent epimerase/dehydratase family protein [Sphingomicrobium sp.]
MAALEPHVADTIRTSDARIVIAGAGGWIGLATLDLLNIALGDQFEARVHAFGSNRRTLRLRDGTTIDQHPLCDLARLPSAPTILLHLAFLTKDRAEAMDEAAYRAANRAIDDLVLSALDTIGTQAIFIASSGAAASTNSAPAMQLYGSLKREQETRFANWAERADRRAVIARLFNLSGPYINKQTSYALAAFILDALAGGPIRIRAPQRVVRSYVAIRELMSLVFALLLDGGKSTTRFDSGGDPLEMQEIALAVVEQCGNVAIDRPRHDPATIDNYTGDSAQYAAMLARYRITPVSFADQIAETVDYLSFSDERSGAIRLASDRPA